MISSEVQRTLVKSPPELWAELSDPASLGRHLGELGEIRITRADPEKLVEWEAETASGTVEIKASGWGTKVTLTASRELPSPVETPNGETAIAAGETAQAPVAEPQPSGLDAWSLQEAEVAVTAAERFGHEHAATLLGTDLQRAAEAAEPEAAEAEAIEPGVAQPEVAEPEAEPDYEAIAETAVHEPEGPEPRRGFFARLFGRGRERQASFDLPQAEPAAEEAERAELIGSESPQEAPEPLVPPLPPVLAEPAAPAPLPAAVLDAPAPDLSAELKAAEEAAEEEVTAILTGVLDRLGAAHHRPFSRS